jgi:dipeptidyl aminopeptidase/acylaminoacyl peptidase
MSAMIYPDDYQVAFSGNPVSNLAFRMSYKSPKYRSIFESKNLIGKTVEQDREAYIKRSPIGHVQKLKIPILIHTTDSDKVVRVEEVQTLVEALKKAKKDVTFKVYQNAPGDHSFERMHTELAREARIEVYKFLADILKPENPFKNSTELTDSWIIR